MKLSHVDRHYVFFVETMTRCKKCREYMIDKIGLIRQLNIGELRNGGVKTCSNEFGVCDDCLASGGYPMTCDACKQTRTYPFEFAYKTVVSGYEGDFDIKHICNDCVVNKPQEVIKMLARADDIEIEHS